MRKIELDATQLLALQKEVETKSPKRLLDGGKKNKVKFSLGKLLAVKNIICIT